ncbi:MAG: GntR family transcriptional regulator [Phycisphaeraceae bacterium]|nr:GntR family transcriptional regulator [Phycisphaeraceae bacterium]
MTRWALNRDDPRPLHVQSEDMLRRLIRQPRYRKGERLPEEHDLARRMGVSRGTVREALKRLVSEGLLERRAGVGTRVVISPVRTSLSEWPSFTREMARRGITAETLGWCLKRMAANREVARALEIEPGRMVTFLDRLRSAGDEPAVWFRSWFHPRLGDLRELKQDQPLYEAIEKLTGVAAARSDETIRAESADAATARKLRIRQGATVLVRQRNVRDAGGRPFEYALAVYRADRFSYSISLQRSAP